ncbi:UPF0175 family protein [candidate division KSB1 bacterium]|nr:UPF0175 family protein [candidate division KSB1 bacterium]MBL7092722.1 UPF0175 family protein [candidate division KSB1 bacterium]
METIEIKIQVPREILKNIPDISKYTYEKFVLGLYLDEEISTGKAARMLNMPQDKFLEFCGKNNIPYFRSTPEEIQTEIQIMVGL